MGKVPVLMWPYLLQFVKYSTDSAYLEVFFMLSEVMGFLR